MLAGNKVIITVAINGGMQQDRDGAVIPKQPAEIGEAAARCYEAGAAMIHVHARDTQGKNTGDREVYSQIIREIRARSPILIQTTNGIGVRRDPATGGFIWPTDTERLGRHPRHRGSRTARPPQPATRAGPVRDRRRLGGLLQPGRRLSRGNALCELPGPAPEDHRSRL